MNPALWEFNVTNLRTKETAKFLGQGQSMAEAWEDGYANLGHKVAGQPLPLNVTLPDGQHKSSTQRDFERIPPFPESTAQSTG